MGSFAMTMPMVRIHSLLRGPTLTECPVLAEAQPASATRGSPVRAVAMVVAIVVATSMSTAMAMAMAMAMATIMTATMAMAMVVAMVVAMEAVMAML